ncbi:enoyl-CoA hydratase/isomerase family protein [Pseudofulvimonas gallinarii]|jgi:enoyl-CoA hydratase|uniref:Enoyl-CoA hydratase n=1 Tax=Pseudofulvimonas gallinarii TaxID=634155 RepID=A0A4S3KU51_9GAMM|nr:enoyl-CoA hydratase-related protein [Pseudofulvimonas gallinarii]TCS92526.1 enoyl-CoA hydratase [Pseudofulvimonas gallinarii]THD12735.1 enoyl-CoA hydratase [Pseudofulvimonas gallinarii]
MSFATLLVSNENAVRTIAINRPDKLNALNRQVISELHVAFDQAAADDGVRVVILTGGGEKAFVAGADISEMTAMSPVQLRDFSRQGQALMTKIERLGKPVIAAINGFALGGGFELAMGCHLRLAADTAKIGQPEVKLGLVPGFGGTQRLLRLAGRGAALELCLTGEPVDALRAFQLGLVSRVVAAANLAGETAALAGRLAALAPQALRGVIDAIAHGGEAALDQGLDYETQVFAVLASTDDMREGTSAFLEKRKPTFTGR